MDLTALIALITAVGTAISVLVTRRKTDAEAGNVVVDSAEKAVKLATEQLERMEKRLEQSEWHIARLEQQAVEWKAERRILLERVQRLESFIRLNTAFNPDDINGEPF